MVDLIGQTLGQYRIIEQIGQGGMATVYKAYQPSLDRYVAIKVLPPYFAHEPGFAMRFTREAKAIAKLNHPNILPIYDFGQEGDLSYIVMKYVEAGTLKDTMGEPLALDVTADIMRQIAEALDHAHQRGILHRDVKPSNVLLDEGRWVLLTDFGLAKMVEGSAVLTASGVGVGTPAYMAPEQGRGEQVSAHADIYSLGVVLYEMLTGRVPFEAETPMAVVIKHITDPLPLPRSINPQVPDAVERVVLKALAKEPSDRFSSTTEMASALTDAVAAAAEPAPETVEIPVEELLSPPPPISEPVVSVASLTAKPPTPAPPLVEPVPAPTPTLPAAEVALPTRKPFPWKVIGAVAGIILLALAAIFVVSNLGGEKKEGGTPTVAETATGRAALVTKAVPTSTPKRELLPTQKPSRPGEELRDVRFENVYLKSDFEGPSELKDLPDGWAVGDDGSGNHVLIGKEPHTLAFPGSMEWPVYILEMRVMLTEGEEGYVLVRGAEEKSVSLVFADNRWELVQQPGDRLVDRYEANNKRVWHHLRVVAVEDRLAAFLDGDLMFDVKIDPLPGIVGLRAYEGSKIFVDDLRITGPPLGPERAAGEITLWHAQSAGSGEAVLVQLMEEAQATYPGLKVHVELVPLDEIFDRYMEEVSAGGGPDMFLAPNDRLGDFAREGLVLNLDPYLAGKLDSFSKMGIEGMKVDGRLYGVPHCAKTVALYYNRAWVDAPPATTDELLDVVRGGVPATFWASAYSLFGLTGAFGGQLMDNGGRCIADLSPGWKEALEYLLALRDAGLGYESRSGADELFRAGETAFAINGPWALENYMDALGENLGVAPLPAGPRGLANSLTGIDGFFVNPNSQNMQAAVDLALFLTSQESAQLWADEAKRVPVRSDVVPADPLVAALVKISAKGFLRPQNPQFSHYWGPFDETIWRVIEGEVPPEQAVAEACAAMNEAAKLSRPGEPWPFPCEDELGCVVVPPGEPIHIAYLLDRSGSAEQIGLDSLRGVEIAVDNKGEVLGHPIELTGEDSGCSPEGGEEAAFRIVEDPSILAIVGTSCSTAARAAAPVISQAGLVMVSPSSTSILLTDPEVHEPGYLRVAPNDNVQAQVVAQFVREELSVSRAATLHDTSLYSRDLQRLFAEAFKDMGGEITIQAEVGPDEAQVREVLGAVAQTRPELIFLPFFPETGGLVTRLARETGGLEETILVGADGMFVPELLQVAGPAAEGLYLSTPDFSATGDRYEGLLEEYHHKYGEPPLGPFHAYAYDATMMILAAVEQAAAPMDDGTLVIGRQALRDALFATRDFEGLTGTLTCTPHGDCADVRITVYQVVSSEPDSWEPGVNPVPVWP